MGHCYSGALVRFYSALDTHVVRRDVWERTQERLTANHRRKPGKKTPTALQGIVTCGEHCGGKWRISGTRPSRGEIARLYCSHRESPRPGSKQQYAKCVIDRQPLEKMERAILGALRTNFKDYDEHIKLLKSCYRGLGQRLRDIQRGMPGVVKRLEELEEERGRVNHMFEKGSLGEEEFDEKTGLLNSQIQNLRVSIPDMSERERELERVKTYRRQLYQRIQAVKYRKLHDIPLNEVRMFSLEAGYVEDWEHGYVLESEFYPFSRGDYSDQEQLAQAIKLFDIGLVMHPDHVELTGMLPMKIGLSGDEKESPYASHAGGTGGVRRRWYRRWPVFVILSLTQNLSVAVRNA